MATSATMILSITRSTSRLTAGARAVERGDFDHRVPVKRRDQLGDLARTFNHMTDSVQSMPLQPAGAQMSFSVTLDPGELLLFKYKTQHQLLVQMRESDEPLHLHFEHAFELARELVNA